MNAAREDAVADGAVAVATPLTQPEAPAGGLVPADVDKAAAPLWSSVHTNKKDAPWQRVNRAREDAGVEASVAVPVEAAAAAPAPAAVEKGAAPLWAAVHTIKKAMPWQRVNRTREVSVDEVAAAAQAQKAAEAAPAGPVPAAVDKAAAPLWAAVHQEKGAKAKATEPSPWAKVSKGRDTAGAEKTAAAAIAAAAPVEAEPVPLTVAKAAAPLWSEVHTEKKPTPWRKVNKSREAAAAQGFAAQPLLQPQQEEAAVRVLSPQVPTNAPPAPWAKVNSTRAQSMAYVPAAARAITEPVRSAPAASTQRSSLAFCGLPHPLATVRSSPTSTADTIRAPSRSPARPPQALTADSAKRFAQILGGTGTTQVKLSVSVPTKMGESVFVVGSADSLGKCVSFHLFRFSRNCHDVPATCSAAAPAVPWAGARPRTALRRAGLTRPARLPAHPRRRWDINRAVALKWEKNRWVAMIDMPSGTAHKYKYVVKDSRGSSRWQPGPNNILAVRRGDLALEARPRALLAPQRLAIFTHVLSRGLPSVTAPEGA